jgi:membrane fusion protein, heavy metal efflux system
MPSIRVSRGRSRAPLLFVPLAAIALLQILMLSLASAASAHEGHDHGPVAPALPASAKPRVSIQTGAYEIVAVSSGGQLTIFLDRYGSNAPVTDAKIDVVAGGKTIVAEARFDGSYRATVPGLEKPGRTDFVFNVAHKDGDDVLAGTLEIPAVNAGGSPAVNQGAGTVPAQPRTLLDGAALWTGAISLVLGIFIGFLLSKRRSSALPVLAIAFLLQTPDRARAHEGHDLSPAPSGDSLAGDVPRRLADGSVFLPKASQRLMTVRTKFAVEGEANRGTTLVGRIISDPNRSGVVQSIAGGRVSPPETGLPRLGQTVKKGDVLATVIPAIPLADQSTIAEKQRELEGAILLAEQKLARFTKLGPNISPRSQTEDTELEISNLKNRMDSLQATKILPEILSAPIDGVISASHAQAGQVVQGQDILFQIVDPLGLWVEALVFDQLDPGAITAATAVTPDSTVMQLKYVGRGRALQQQAVQLQFSIENAPASVALGMPVTVIAKKAQTLRGMLFPRDALVRGANGDLIVWQHVEPERFVPRPVRIEPFDGEQVLITAGISTTDRIVVHGAELLAQVR